MNWAKVKRFLIGEPFPTSKEIHERLDNVRALAVFASDPISSNAYATEAIMSVLLLAGIGAIRLTLPIALAIATLVLIVVFSYIQTILHYPRGGGSYIVSKDNLGTFFSLLAAGALLTDYILTVSVSVSAGVRAITSAFPQYHDYRVLMALVAIILLTWINLRGVRESGTVFIIPTYAFIGGVLIVVLYGLLRYFGLFGLPRLQPAHTGIDLTEIKTLTGFAYTWILLRAFAAGCTALTGIEAISDGVQAFKPPEAPNAAKTLVTMAISAMSLFIGISFLSTHLHLIPNESESILSQMTRQITGGGFMYYWVQLFTMLILILAANTGFQDFPRLSYFLARDNFMPRWMVNRGDRLVFSSGIVVLALLSSVLVIIFRADEIAMLPLYALGVMISFTVSQAAMFKLMGRIGKIPPGEEVKTLETVIHYEKGWQWKRAVYLIGSLTTFVVLTILILTKFHEGAWITLTVIALFIAMFYAINAHYQRVREALRTRDLVGKEDTIVKVADVVILPMGDVHRGTLRALQYATRLSNDVRAVCITTSQAMKERLVKRWNRFPGITKHAKLVCIDYDYRDIMEPLIDYILEVNLKEFPDRLVTVVIPEFITENALTQFLHNRTADVLRKRLYQYPDIIIISIPFHIRRTYHMLQARRELDADSRQKTDASPEDEASLPASDINDTRDESIADN